MIKKLIIKIIYLYQVFLSPDHSQTGKQKHPHGFCRYYPSCSEYARQSITKDGVVKGLGRGLWRVARCNPFSKGGYDPVSKDSYIRIDS